MRYLVLSDIHANLEALESCFEAASGKYDQVICLGDIVGYGPDPNPVIDLVRERVQVIIRGNHDKACSGITNAEDFTLLARLSTVWTRSVLSVEHLSFLRGLQAGPLTLPGFELVHGSAEDEDQYVLGPAEAIPALNSQTVQLVFFGHTHVQGGFSLSQAGVFRRIQGTSVPNGSLSQLSLKHGNRYLINPGSVGQPRDHDWRAAFAIFDNTARQIDYYRTEYDVSRTQNKMSESGLPEPLATRLAVGR